MSGAWASLFFRVVLLPGSTVSAALGSSGYQETSLKRRMRAPRDKPNFVMFFVDDLGYGDTGFTGHPTVASPNIDKLAFGGKVLTTWYSGCPVCSGSRAALMTGRQFTRTGVPGVLMPTESVGLPLNETTLAEQLKRANYTTAAVGKWHLGQRRVYLPGSRGFDHYLGIPYSDDMGKARATPCNGTAGCGGRAASSGTAGDAQWMREAYEEAGYLLAQGQRGGETAAADPGGEFLPLVHQEHGKTQVLEQPLDFTYLADKYNSFAVDFIRKHADGPFFLYMPFSHVHVTNANQPEKQYAGCAFKNSTLRGPFGDALAETDWIIGNVHSALQEEGIEENTLILFTGDNGPWMVQGLSGGSVGHLTGRYSGYWNVGKGSTWEGGIREAAFAYWKGQIGAFSRSAEVVSSMDVFPTFSALAGMPLPAGHVYDGKDMTDVLLASGGRSRHKFLFFYGGCAPALGGPAAVRYGKWKAHWCTGPGLNGCDGCKVVRYEVPLLFNVEKDPSEASPVPGGADSEAAAALRHIQRAYLEERRTFVYGHLVAEPDSPGEGPGQYGVCCDRSRHCDCDGPPSAQMLLSV